MKWSDLPEVTQKKNDRAPFNGVLVPEQNYRNYRTLDELAPELDRLVRGDGLPLCAEPSSWENPLLWGVIGVLVGGVAMAVIK